MYAAVTTDRVKSQPSKMPQKVKKVNLIIVLVFCVLMEKITILQSAAV